MKQLYAKYVNDNAGREDEREEVKELFIFHQFYPVEKIDMGQSHTNVTLKGFKGVFNSVFFEFFFYDTQTGIWIPHDIFADPDYNPYIKRKEYTFTGKDGVERTFKVNDVVITTYGLLGRIESFCTCTECERRGFYEPSIKYFRDNFGNDYITNYEYEDNFTGYYKIGNNIFGDKPSKEDVQSRIEENAKKIEKAENNIKEYKRLLEFLYPVEK